MKVNQKLVGNLASAGAYTIFGLNIVICKDIANSAVIPPMALFALRSLGASILFWLISLFLPKEKMSRRDLGLTVCASFLGLFMTQVTFLFAITMTTSIDASILSAMTPIFTMIAAAIFLKEPITLKKAGGVTASFIGVLILIFNSVSTGRGAESTTTGGVILMLLNGLSFAFYLGIFRPLISRYSVVTFMKWMFLFSLIMSIPLSAREFTQISFSAIPSNVIWELGFLIFFATFVAYFLIPIGQQRVRPTIVSMYTYLQPLLAVIISICVGMDVITWKKVLATVLVIGGVMVVNRSRSARQ